MSVGEAAESFRSCFQMRRRHGRRINISCDQRTARFSLYSGSRASLVWALRRRHTYHAARFVRPSLGSPCLGASRADNKAKHAPQGVLKSNGRTRLSIFEYYSLMNTKAPVDTALEYTLTPLLHVDRAVRAGCTGDCARASQGRSSRRTPNGVSLQPSIGYSRHAPYSTCYSASAAKL